MIEIIEDDLPEQVTFDNYRPNPSSLTVTVFSVSQEEAKELGAVNGTEEDFKDIGIE